MNTGTTSNSACACVQYCFLTVSVSELSAVI